MPGIGMNGSFCNQVGGVAGVFEGWTACEKTVVLCALLRRVPTNSLKLLRYAIDAALIQNFSAENHRQENDANDPEFVAALVQGTEEDLDSDIGNRLNKLVTHLPLLKPGNDKAKDLYLRCVPHLVRHCVDVSQYTEECQILLSYLLIHPAINSSDRRSLTVLLKHLENHVVHGASKPKMDFWQSPELPADELKPMWPSNGSQTFRRTIGKNVEFKSTLEQVISNNTEPICIQINNEVLHESFSKNGTEIELNGDNDRVLFDPVIIQPKARRSNSLTPPSTSYVFLTSSSENLNNDPYFVQKPRSFSLSSEHSLLNVRPMGNLPTSSGSETRLDDLRYNNVGDHGGMSTVAHWLKTLRLHKYIWLFSNISYDEMMSIDEVYLQRLGVTKGARHKLLLSIRKLSERESVLEGMERELSSGSFISLAGMTALLEQLRNIVISPIKPDSILATLVVRVLDLSSSRLLSNGASYHDGGVVMALHCWLVDRALSHDAFSRSAALAAELKSLKYRVPPRQFLAHLGDAPFQRRPKPRWRASISGGSWQIAEPSKKSCSFPSFPSAPLSGTFPSTASMGDINSRLESLCLQMTEQAIN